MINKKWLFFGTLCILAGLAYLPLINRFGFTFDDWYLIWAANAYGSQVFHEIFSIDRPLRAFVLIPAYTLFGSNVLGYNLSAWLWRVLSGLFFWKTLRLTWPKLEALTFAAAVLFVLYPGFLQQYNGVDYQSQILSMAAAMLSIYLTVLSWVEKETYRKALLAGFSVAFGWVYLGLVEYEAGLEALRLLLLAVLIFRQETTWRLKMAKLFKNWLPYSLIVIGFAAWRVFLFEGGRKATDAGVQLMQVFISPLPTLGHWGLQLLNDFADVFLLAWFEPLRQTAVYLSTFWPGIILAMGGAVLFGWVLINHPKVETTKQTNKELLAVGLLAALAGILPIIMVNREVAFPYFSRYALASSAGVVLLAAGLIAYLRPKFQVLAAAGLVFLALLTHQANNAKFTVETAAMQNYWWQVAWRVPQLEQNTTLVAQYPLAPMQEDYFVWGPANLIYYPEALYEKDIQPGLYAALPTETTLEKVLARERQQYDKRRGITTYANYRNILLLLQPTPQACVRIVGGDMADVSAQDGDLFKQMIPYAEVERIQAGYPQPNVPLNVFGPEPEHGWCYYYQKASLARQTENWVEAARLGEEALKQGLKPKDEIEWIPFIQAFAATEQLNALQQISNLINEEHTRRQVCISLDGLNQAGGEPARTLFCQKQFGY